MNKYCPFGLISRNTYSPSGVNRKSMAPYTDLPGPAGERFDYLAVDEDDHYILSAHLGPGLLYVLDARSNRVVATIRRLPGITGLEYVPGLHKVYTSNW